MRVRAHSSTTLLAPVKLAHCSSPLSSLLCHDTSVSKTPNWLMWCLTNDVNSEIVLLMICLLLLKNCRRCRRDFNWASVGSRRGWSAGIFASFICFVLEGFSRYRCSDRSKLVKHGFEYFFTSDRKTSRVAWGKPFAILEIYWRLTLMTFKLKINTSMFENVNFLSHICAYHTWNAEFLAIEQEKGKEC